MLFQGFLIYKRQKPRMKRHTHSFTHMYTYMVVKLLHGSCGLFAFLLQRIKRKSIERSKVTAQDSGLVKVESTDNKMKEVELKVLLIQTQPFKNYTVTL